ncbi:MAG: hypothetical protein ACFFD2_18950 [Promethearchaeota archaeon]
MALKKKKTIVIKDPQLRKIRNNIRDLVLKASRTVQHRILDEIERLKTTDSPNNNQVIKELYHRESLIEDSLRHSILLCPVCFKSDKGMVYNPVRKVWYCVECYEKLRKGNIKRGTPEEFP